MNSEITTKRVSLDIPSDILDQIDKICKESFISKRKWFIDAQKNRQDCKRIKLIILIKKRC
jgi:metal-responsive CopG/Arc/MetJ family transcriptional regulator